MATAALLATGVVVAPVAAPQAAASGLLVWPDGEAFTTFGPNQAVTIDLGTIAYTKGCPPDGNDDFFYAIADVYIVPVGSVAVGAALFDVGGVFNTVVGFGGGLFVSETIGYTEPAGSIPPGTYSIVYDECQDGWFDPHDTLVEPAFEVVIPADIPPAPSSLFALKADAVDQRDRWRATCGIFNIAVFIAQNAPSSRGAKGVEKRLGRGLSKFSKGVSKLLGVDPVDGTKRLCTNMVLHYDRLVRDPADPNYTQLTALSPREPLGAAPSADPVVVGLWDLVDASIEQAALVEALVTAAERYQGADAAGDGDAALQQARDLRRIVELTRGSLADTSAASVDAAAALAADPRDLDASFADFDDAATRWMLGSFDDVERRFLANLDLPASLLDDLSVGVAEEYAPFDRSALQAELDGMAAAHAALAAGYATLEADLDGLIAHLESQSVVSDQLPVAKAGGPYGADEGTTVVLDASGSTAPAGIVSHDWDLDGDGLFDDASGPTPSVLVSDAVPGHIGLRVTDTAGRSDIDYARLTANEVNSPPFFVSTTSLEDVVATTGIPEPLSVVVDDPDGDPVTLTWTVDGAPAGTGTSFDWAPGPADVGLHRITVTADDGQTTGGARSVSFIAVALAPDGDADEWTEIVDCDDADPDVNPGQSEIPSNGVDDDCDPYTPDAGDAPITAFSFDPPQPAVGETVTFSDETVDPDGTIVEWTWDFGDGTRSDVQHPTHSFATAGVFTVTLDVVDDDGAPGTSSLPVTVVDPDAPIADFDVSPAPWLTGSPIGFTDLSTDPNAGSIIGWSWDFGDGGTSALQHPTHTYAAPGVYEVRLEVEDTEGKFGAVIGTLRVHHPTTPPDAGFTFAPTTPEELELVVFSNTSSDPDGDPITYLWDFGDGSTSTLPTPAHAYALAGAYEVSLLAVDVNGAADVATQVVVVLPPPTAPLVDAGPDRSIDEGLEIRLETIGTGDTRIKYTDRNSDDTHTATIDWGDGTPIESAVATDGAVTAVHTYPDDGVFVVEACVTDSTGRTGCDSFQVTVQNVDPDVSLLDLNRWIVEDYPIVADFPNGEWIVADDGLTVEQVVNGPPTLFISEFTVFDTEAVVNISVSGADDDLIGFVLGFDPGDTLDPDADYLLVDWKRLVQLADISESCPTPGSIAQPGLAVSRVTGVPTADELFGHVDFDQPPCSPLGVGVTELARAATLGSTGWAIGTEYEFRFRYAPDRLQIWVNGVLEFDLAGDFPSGRFGFYNFSQANVLYRAFDLQAAGGLEGTPLSLTGSFKDDGVFDSHTGVFEWGDGEPASQGVVAELEGAGTAASQHVYVDDGVYLAEVCVTDDDGGVGCDDIEVRIANAPPVVEAGPDVTTGGEVTLAPATFTDLGVEDVHTATIDWGDTTVDPGTVDQAPGAGSVAGAHTYGAPGVYTVEVCVTDDEGDSGCDTFEVTISEPAPPEVVDIEPGHTIPEGAEHTHWLSFSDPDADSVHTVTVDWGDGSPIADAVVNEAKGVGNVSASHTYADDGVYTVVWTVCDADGCTTAEVLETVTNLAPVVDAADPITSTTFGTGPLDIADFTDAGIADVHTATIDWGDGGGPQPATLDQSPGSGVVSGGHTYAANGTYPVEVCVTDDDGATGCDSTSVTVDVPYGTIVIEKRSTPAGETGFGFTSDVPGHEAFQLDDGQQHTMVDVLAGSYTVTEDDHGPAHLLADLVCDDGNSTVDRDRRSASIELAPGETVSCTFVNLATAGLELTKFTDGVVDPARDWQFTLFEGPDGFGTDVVASDSSAGDDDGVLDFDAVRLDPRATYTVCELGVPAGWSSQWRIDTDGDGVPDTIVIADNPNADDDPRQDLGNRCFDVGAGTSYPVAPAGSVAFEVDNRVPGGDPRTPGYWKNWNMCTNGGQADNAARNGGAEAGFFLLDDILNDPGIAWGAFTIDSCELGVDVLDQRDVSSGKKRANDAPYTLAMHLLAAELNFAAGAEVCTDAQDAVVAARALLVDIGFDGSGHYLRPKEALYSTALDLAAALDEYNNGLLC